MLIKKPDDVKSHEITDQKTYLSRRNFLRAALLAGTSAATMLAFRLSFVPKAPPPARITGQFPGLQPPSLPLPLTDRDSPTSYENVTGYNNFYEFSTYKSGVAERAKNFVTRPWTIDVGGMVHKPKTFDIDELMRIAPPEERTYRFRCVEGWSMVIPWIGFPLASLLAAVEPLGSAQYVAFQTLLDPERMPNQKPDFLGQTVLNWPYVEGLRLDEAQHPLTILALGLYGELLRPQNGAPIRLVVPWKYGFKSIKSIVKITVTDREPPTTWNIAAPNEYGFYSNVNPKVDHPRWSQATERRIGEFGLRNTLLFNGYADQVASLYTNLNLNINF